MDFTAAAGTETSMSAADILDIVGLTKNDLALKMNQKIVQKKLLDC